MVIIKRNFWLESLAVTPVRSQCRNSAVAMSTNRLHKNGVKNFLRGWWHLKHCFRAFRRLVAAHRSLVVGEGRRLVHQNLGLLQFSFLQYYWGVVTENELLLIKVARRVQWRYWCHQLSLDVLQIFPINEMGLIWLFWVYVILPRVVPAHGKG